MGIHAQQLNLGNGLDSTSVLSLALLADSTTAGNVAAVSVTANGVGLDVSTIVGTNLEADGSGNLRIAAAAAGAGLSGGATLALAVDGTLDTFKTPVRLRQSTNVTLVGGTPQTVDGVTPLSIGDRILCDGQTTTSEDGIYEVQTVGTSNDGTWVRTADAATGLEAAGWFIMVLEGTLENLYRVDSALGGATIGTDGWTLGIFSGSTATPGLGLVAGSGTDLDVNTGDGIAVTSDRVVAQVSTAGSAQQYGGLVRTRNSAGDGAGTADAGYLAIQTDNSTLEVDASNQVAVKAGGVTGTQLNASVAGNGLAGGGGSALSVGVQNGLAVSANAVGIDLTGANGAITYSGTTSHTYPNGVTAVGLFVTGTMVDANQVVNKAYVDNAITGLLWKDPVDTPQLIGNVQVLGLVGNLAALDIEGLSPTAGDAYVVTTANGVGALSSAVIGDIWQYVVTTWTKIVTGVTSFVPSGTYALLSTTTALISPYTDSTDDGKRAGFDGTGLTGALTTPDVGDAYVVGNLSGSSGSTAEGDIREWSGTGWIQIVPAAGGFVPAGTRAILALNPTTTLIGPYNDASDDCKIVDFTGASNTGVDTGDTVDSASLLVQDPGHIGFFDNLGYVFEGTVPTGVWVQFTGSGTISAGTGLTKSGSTINAIGNADGSIIANANDLQVGFATTLPGLESADSGVRIAAAAAGAGLTGGGGAALAVLLETSNPSLQISSDELGIKFDGSGGLQKIAAGTGIKLPASSGLVLAVGGLSLNLRFYEDVLTDAATWTGVSSEFEKALTAEPLYGTAYDNYNFALRSGVADMTNVGSGTPAATATQYRIIVDGGSGKFRIGADPTGTGYEYRVRYVALAA